MRELFATKPKKTFVAVCIILVFSVSGILIFNRFHENKQIEIPFSLHNGPEIPKISTKPDYIVYPTISNITITHQDNISLYASSGDGLSRETAYIIENFSIYDALDYSIFISNTNEFVKIRNFQIFHNDTWPPSVHNDPIIIRHCTNLIFENGSFSLLKKNEHFRYYYAFDCQNVSSLVISDILFHDNFIQQFVDVNDAIFEKYNYIKPLNDPNLIMFEGCENLTIAENNFTFPGMLDWVVNRIYIEHSNNVKFFNNVLANIKLNLYTCTNSSIHDNSGSLTTLFWLVGSNNTSFRKNYLNIHNGGILLLGCRSIVIEQNIELFSFGFRYEVSTFVQLDTSDEIVIRNNTCHSDFTVFYFKSSDNVLIERNNIVCSYQYVFNLNLIKWGDNIRIRYNSFTGTYRQLFDSYLIPKFWLIFTNTMSFKPVLLIIFLCTFVLEIFGVFFLIYSQKSEIKKKMRIIYEIPPRRMYFYPLTTAFIFLYFTSDILVNGWIYNIPRFFYNSVFQLLYPLLLFTLIGGVITLIIGKLKKKAKKFDQQIEQIAKEDVKTFLIKSGLYVVLPNLILLPSLFYLLPIFSNYIFLLYAAIMILIIGLGFKHELEKWDITFNQTILSSLIVSTDYIITFVVLQRLDPSDLSTAFFFLMFILRFFYFGAFLVKRIKER